MNKNHHWRLYRTGDKPLVFEGVALLGPKPADYYSANHPQTSYETIGLFKTKAGRYILHYRDLPSYLGSRKHEEAVLDVDTWSDLAITELLGSFRGGQVLAALGRETVERID